MPDERPPDQTITDHPAGDRLETWGEIAAYLGREIRTVQRWEKTMALPVRRLVGAPDRVPRVFALKSEVDAWRREHEVLKKALDSSEEVPAPESGPTTSTETEEKSSSLLRRRPVQAFLVVVVTALLTIGTPKLVEMLWPSKVILGVRPFGNLGEQTEAFIPAGLTEEMVARLGQLHPDRLLVVPLTGAPPAARASSPNLRVDYILQGTVRRINDQVAITAQLIQTSNQTVVWGNSYERDVKDLLRVQTDVADAIVTEVFNKLPHPAPTAREVNRDAYLAYLEGRYFWNRRTADSIQKAVALFQKSIAADATYAPAYAGLADCYELLGSAPYTAMPPKAAFPLAEAAARKALELDERLAEAHVSLGYAYLAYEWNFSAADREFKRALELRPGYATAHQYYGYYLTAAGQLPQAIEQRKRAVDLDPLSPLMASALGEAYYQSRQFDQTIAQNQRALSLDPAYAIALVNIGRAYQQKGMHAEAQAAFQKILAAVPDDPAVLALLGHEYAVSGRRDEALQSIAKLNSLAAHRYVPAIYYSLVYTGLGDLNEAFRWMDKAVDERTEYLIYLGSDPLADPLRRDPRFAVLMKRVGLPFTY